MSEAEVETALPSKGSPLLRLNSISPYYTMFPVDFPFGVLKEAKRGQWVLDPFCGRGTTNFAARLLGLPSVGIDSNPVATAIAAAKLVHVTPRVIVDLCRRILKSPETPIQVPEGEFWSLCYAPRTLEQICAIRQSLLSARRTPVRTALRALMLGVLHGPRYKGSPGYLSNQMPRTYSTKPEPAVTYWKRHALSPEEIDVLELVARRAEFTFSEVPAKADGAVYQGDSRSVTYPRPHGGFHWIVTSPPYWGMRSYWPDQWLRNWFLGGPPYVAYPTNGQAGRGSLSEFERAMASVWKNCGRAAAPGARLAIRFGALPCQRVDPLELIDQSLSLADCGWRRTAWRAAGAPRRGSRQAEQFQKKPGASIDEVDIFAVLET